MATHLLPTLGSKFVKPVMLPPGRARLATTPWVTGSLTPVKTIGTVRVASCAPRTAEMALARIKSGARFSNSEAVARARSTSEPPVIDCEIATNRPPKFIEALLEHGDTGMRLRVVLRQHHQYANAPHPLRLLRARRERPRCRRAAEAAI
jgi:hypothetical protein